MWYILLLEGFHVGYIGIVTIRTITEAESELSVSMLVEWCIQWKFALAKNLIVILLKLTEFKVSKLVLEREKEHC